MPAFGFANIEQMLTNTVLATFANIALLDSNDQSIEATLSKANTGMGEFDLSREQRMQLVINKQLHAGLQTGDVLTPNPLQYTPAELAAMPASYTLDALAEDDGLMQRWWVL
jgi:hypothetical protein